MSTNRAELTAEIQRLDGELKRIAQELEQLRRKVEPPRSGRTQAFPSPISSSPAHAKHAPTSEIPSTQPSTDHPHAAAPAPSAPVKTSTRTLPPSPSVPNTGRRVASPAIGLDAQEPPPAQPQRGRRDMPPREGGRYGYVHEKTGSEKPRSSSRR